MRYLRASKYLKTTVERTLTTQKVNACSPQTACFVFDWKYLETPLFGKFGSKTQNF